VSVETNVLREMVRADLELAFEHLNNDLPELAEHELRNALEKVAQIKDAQRAIPDKATPQPLLITLPTDEQQTH
jgi:hypothetical protein